MNDTIIYDNNGYPAIDRVEIMRSAMQPLIEAKRVGKKSVKAYHVKCIFYSAIKEIPMVDNNVALSLTKEQLSTVFQQFVELVAFCNDYTDFVPTKQIFEAFAGISPFAYNNLLSHGSQEQIQAMELIDNFIMDMNIDAGGEGIQKFNATKFRMQAKQVGHNVTLASSADGIIDVLKQQLSPTDYTKQLDEIRNHALESTNKDVK